METHATWLVENRLIVLAAGVIIGTKFILNLRALWQTSKYLKKYNHYLTTDTLRFLRDIPCVRDLFRKAGIAESQFSRIEPAGYGYARTMKAPILANIHIRDDDIAPSVLLYFEESKGVFRKRMLDAINPLYWLETIIFLPRATLGYFGVSDENIAVKVLQLLYWVVSGATAIIKFLEISK